MENETKFSPLTDHLLLQKIFSNLTLSEVKVARIVCRHWGDEGALNYRHRALAIHVNPVHMTYRSRMTEDNLEVKEGREEDRRALRNFLVTYKLPHTLHLSLLGFHPWLINTPSREAHSKKLENGIGSRNRLFDPFYKQENNLCFGCSVSSNYFLHTTPFIKELRLELMLKQEEDFKMLEQIMEALEASLEQVSLDIVVFKDPVLERNTPTKDHKLSRTKILSIRLVEDGGDYSGRFTVPGPKTLLSLFPNISFLDLISWRNYRYSGERLSQLVKKTSKLLAAATELELKIDGLHAAPRTEEDFQAILNYCSTSPLKFLYLNIHWREAESSVIILFINGIIKECGETLERFDLTWRLCEEGRCQQMQLPFLKKLKSLNYVSKFLGWGEFSFDSYGNCHRRSQISEGGEQLSECIGFKELFSDYGRILNSKFPALESLSLILVEPGEEGLWAEIFPPENDGKCISLKIRTLVVTFAGECESEEIQKFPRMLFPKLRQFRHGKWAENGNKLFVCHHEYDADRRLIGKWSWLAAIKTYFKRTFEPGSRSNIIEHGSYFYTIREKFRQRLGDHGPWDTAWDIE